MKAEEKRKFISDALDSKTNSKGRRYLLLDKNNCNTELKERALNTIIALHDCTDNNSTLVTNKIGEEVEYYFTEYSLPNSRIKQFVESTIVYLNVPAIELVKPVIISERIGFEEGKSSELMTPNELINFFTEYYEFTRNDVTLQTLSKDKTITLNDLSCFEVPWTREVEVINPEAEILAVKGDENGVQEIEYPTLGKDNTVIHTIKTYEYIYNGGTKLDESMCVLEGFRIPWDVYEFARHISGVDLDKLKYELF